MREVTDTALLNQLNGGQQSTPAGLRPVENEKILNQLNASDQPQQQEQPSVSNRAMSALLNQQSPFAPRSRPEEEKYWGATEKVAGTLMDYAPYFMGGTGLTKLGAKALSKFPGTAEGLAKFASKHPKLAKYIPESMANAIGGAGYGAATAEDGNRLSSAMEQGAIGAAIPAVGGAVVDPLLRYGAQKYAQSAIPAFTEKAGKKLRELLPTSAYAKKLEDRFLGASKENKTNWSNAEKSAKELDKSLVSPMRSEGRIVSSKDRNKFQSTVENTDTMGNPIKNTMIGKDFSNIPSGISRNEIVGYDAAGAPIFKPREFPSQINEIPTTKNMSGSVPRRTSYISGEHDASGAPIYNDAINFNNSPYKSYIESFKNKVGAMEPAKKQEYMQALKLADKAEKMYPKSFDGAISLRKNINQDMKEYLNSEGKGFTPQNSKSKQFLSGLKSNLKNETIDAQKGIVPEESLNVFKNQWEAANKSHQGVQEFYKTPQASSGVVKPTRQMRERFENVKNGGKLDPSVISKYVPSLSPQGSQGVEGLKQLAKVMGSKKAAVDAAKAHIFRKPIENGANTVDVAATYAKLSPSQKKYMFGNGDEGKMLEAINRTRLAFGREPEKTLAKIGHGMMSLGIPGGLGFAGGLASGESWDKSLMTGLATAAASKGIKGLAGRTATPGSVNRAIRFGQNGTTNFGRNANYIGQAYMNTPPEARR